MKKLRNNLTYLWSDYKWILLACLVVLGLVAHFALTALTQKETAVYAMLIDCHTDTPQKTFEADALRALELDPGLYRAQIETGLMFTDTESGSYAMTSLSRFLADIGSGKLDICAMPEEEFVKYDRSGTWTDLRKVFPEPAREDSSRESRQEGEPSPDAFLIRDGRVIGMYADRLPALAAYGCYENPESRGVVGILYNAPHSENAAAYLRWLGKETEE